MNLLNLLEYEMSLDEALASPRVHHQWRPDELRTEPLPAGVADALRARGHKVVEVKGAGAAQVVMASDQEFKAAHDPRVRGKAAAW